ncbi:Mylk3 [Symbiodinium microadriaticum]|nr:Mylk3 [Symbiodinium microadriaticum]
MLHGCSTPGRPLQATLQGRYTYSTHDVLGEGRAARVYKGIDRRLGSPVAIKIYRDTDRMCQHCFHNSIEMSSWLKRPMGRLPAGSGGLWTVDIMGHSVDSRGYPGVDSDGVMFTVMELGAESLEDVLANRCREERHFSLTELRELHWALVSLACQLESHGVVHLDIKPSNIVRFLKGERCQWKLVDLDCAVRAGVAVRYGDVTFTPPYMAPELARAYLKAGPGNAQHCPVVLAVSMDLWSVGICVLETVFLSSLLTDRYLQLKRRTGGDNEFLRWLGEEPGGLILPNMYDAARRRSGELADFLVAILKKDRSKRLGSGAAAECLKHAWFDPWRKKMQMTTAPVRRAQSVQQLPSTSTRPADLDSRVRRTRSDLADQRSQLTLPPVHRNPASASCVLM